jgi:hypothetical protein
MKKSFLKLTLFVLIGLLAVFSACRKDKTTASKPKTVESLLFDDIPEGIVNQKQVEAYSLSLYYLANDGEISDDELNTLGDHTKNLNLHAALLIVEKFAKEEIWANNHFIWGYERPDKPLNSTTGEVIDRAENRKWKSSASPNCRNHWWYGKQYYAYYNPGFGGCAGVQNYYDKWVKWNTLTCPPYPSGYPTFSCN